MYRGLAALFCKVLRWFRFLFFVIKQVDFPALSQTCFAREELCALLVLSPQSLFTQILFPRRRSRMKRYILAAAMAITATTSFAQLTWTTASQSLKPLFSAIQMHGSAVCQVGPKKFIYVLGGNVSAKAPGIITSGDSPYMYYAEILSTGTLSTWTTCTATLPVHPTTPTEPSMAYIERACDSYNGRIYIVGGNNNGAPPERTDLQILAPQAIGDITAVTTITPTGTYTPIIEKTVVINQATGKLYVVGGGTSGTRPTTVVVAQIDAGTGAVGTFSNAGTLATGVGQAPAVIKNGRLYVIGGNTPTGSLATTQYATINGDGTLGTFVTASAQFAEGLFDGDAIANPNRNEIYLMAGTKTDNSTTRNNVYKLTLSATTGDITSAILDSNMPTAPGAGLRRMGAVTDGISIYVPGGRQDATNLTSENYTAVLPLALPFTSAAQDWSMFE
jgi:hypothetical protein